MKILAAIFLILTISNQASEPKLVYWDGISGHQAGEKKAGEQAKAYPYLANLRLFSKGQRGYGVGSGGLIAESWVITAKHVANNFVKDSAASSIKVTFPDGTTRRATKAFAHPERDLALIKLDKPVDHIEIPALQSEDIPPSIGKKDIPMTITGTNGSFLAYDVVGYSEDIRIFTPDILRGGDSGSPVIARDVDGDAIVISTLMGKYSLPSRNKNQFLGNMSYARFAQVGGVKKWIVEQVGAETKIKWKNLLAKELPPVPQSFYRGTPEYQLNLAAYLYLKGRPVEAKKIALPLVPKLKGRIREAIGARLIAKCRTAEKEKEKEKAK